MLLVAPRGAASRSIEMMVESCAWLGLVKQNAYCLPSGPFTLFSALDVSVVPHALRDTPSRLYDIENPTVPPLVELRWLGWY